jgi:hypothetical protein
MEKMTADLSDLYNQFQSPTVAQIAALGAVPPNVPGITYNINLAVPVNGVGAPITQSRTISTGANQGLIAEIIPMTITVDASRVSGAEVQIVRQVEVALIPVFQFGVFSDSDLGFFPGQNFDFGGRVHTNGSLYLASSDPAGLKFHQKITVVKEVIRQVLPNGFSTSDPGSPRTSPVYLPKSAGGCDAGAPPNATCRAILLTEGSKVTDVNSADNANWTNVSLNTYNGLILNGKTGAKVLKLPFVQGNARPIEIIKRPKTTSVPAEDPTNGVGVSRLYNHAAIRVLLNDNPIDLDPAVPAADPDNIRLANVVQAGGTDYTAGVTVDGVASNYWGEAVIATDADWVNPPVCAGVTTLPVGCRTSAGASSWNLIDGYLRVEIRKPDGTWMGVTREWLGLGFARSLTMPTAPGNNAVHPKAILIFQQQADRNGNSALSPAASNPNETTLVTGALRRNSWFPINMFDTREGLLRDTTQATCTLGGIMNLTELDIGNLRRWLAGTIGVNGNQVDWQREGGYVLYFSDRRGERLPPLGAGPVPQYGAELTGDYGYEDIVNPNSVPGTPNGQLDAGEDVNGNGVVDTYGAANLGDGFGQPGAPPYTGAGATIACLTTARKNRVSGARHALRVVDGALGNLPTDPNGEGFTIGSENPVYVAGHYNANAAGFGDPHASAAIIADAVTLLSTAWDDINTFKTPAPNAAFANRSVPAANTTYYRMAVAAGKNINFQSVVPGGSGDFGLDGGVHNFLRYLEAWGGTTSHYEGSLVSLFYSQYGMAPFKCCTTVYTPPTRAYAFDTDFLDPTKLPPATPKFQDVNNTSAYQNFTPR